MVTVNKLKECISPPIIKEMDKDNSPIQCLSRAVTVAEPSCACKRTDWLENELPLETYSYNIWDNDVDVNTVYGGNRNSVIWKYSSKNSQILHI